MTTTVLGLYNAAISAAEGRGRLATVTDIKAERYECDIWYNQIRQQILEAAYWPSSRTTARLTLSETRDFTVDWAAGDPETEYLYAYNLPVNCLRPWHLVNYEAFTVSWDSVGAKSILSTNVVDAVLIYAHDQTDPAKWSPGLRSAVVYGLAAAISGPLKGNPNLVTKNFRLANAMIEEARMNVATLLHDQKEVLPPPLAARGYSILEETRYYYPHGELFAGAMPNA